MNLKNGERLGSWYKKKIITCRIKKERTGVGDEQSKGGGDGPA